MRFTKTTNLPISAPHSSGCRLRVIHGPDAGLEIEVPGVGLVLGADPSADVVLSDPAVSGKHCSIAPRGDGFQVKDLGSRNGTLLDGAQLTDANLAVGTSLRLGDTVVQLLPAEETISIPPSTADHFGRLVGSGAAMKQIYAVLERACQALAPILLLGESGTGKELAARAVHDHSQRKDGPFVVFDCGASTENLIESDLFGHVKGAFTGAQGDRPGAFELAHGGTLFLDEIGDLPLALQPKLLRLLESGEVTRLGARRPQQFDVRIVAATHRNLSQLVEEGGFRGDLYYRLAVVEVTLPPLRQRLEDLPELVQVFLGREGREREPLESDNLDRLRRYHFPGNVRELRNIVARAVALSLPETPFAELPIMLGPAAGKREEPWNVRADRPFQDAKAEVVARFEKAYLLDLMQRAGGNVSQASRLSGIERKHLYRLLERAGLKGSA